MIILKNDLSFEKIDACIVLTVFSASNSRELMIC